MKKILFFVVLLQCFLFPYQSDVHQDITNEAFNLLKALYPGIELSELGLQLGVLGEYGESQWSTGKVITGSYREDLEDVVWGYGPESSFPILPTLFSESPTSTCTHFWIADQGDNYYTPGVGWPWSSYPNAYQKAIKYINGGWKLLFLESGSQYVKEYKYDDLIQLAQTGIIKQTGYYTVACGDYTAIQPPLTTTLTNTKRKIFVYEILGRLIHLLQDMSVPAHVHGDTHADLSNSLFLPCMGMEWCEDSDEYENALTHDFVHNSWDWMDALNTGGLMIANDFFSNPIKFLFYTSNQIADFFPSDGWGGNHNTPKGSNRFIDEIYSSYNYQCPTTIDAYQIGNSNYVTAIRATATLFFWYISEMDYIKSATFTSSTENTYFQLRNPARSINQNSQYYWKPTPYSIKFDNNIIVDLLADAYNGNNAFLG